MPAPPLPGYALRYLRALGHVLKPVVQIGKEGKTEGLVEATRLALLDHELIKVRILTESPEDRHAVSAELAAATDSVLAQVLGKTFLLYRRHPQKPRIQLPKKSATKRPSKAKEQRRKEGEEPHAEAAPDSPAAPKRESRVRAAAPGDARGATPRGARRNYSAKLKGTSRRSKRGGR